MAPVCYYELYIDEINRLKFKKTCVKVWEPNVENNTSSGDGANSVPTTVLKEYRKEFLCPIPTSGYGSDRFVNKRPFTIRSNSKKLIKLYKKPPKYYAYGIKKNHFYRCIFVENCTDKDFIVEKNTLLSTLYTMPSDLLIKKIDY